MAATNSGHCHCHRHHPPKFVYQEARVTDRRANYPTDDEDSDNFNADHHPIIDPEQAFSRKQPHQRTVPVSGKSLPVNIPDWSKILRDSDTLRSNGDHVDDDDDDGGDHEWLPPHEYLARIRGASLSVHEGVGRTFKGRDLRRLRNAIWKQTGFELD